MKKETKKILIISFSILLFALPATYLINDYFKKEYAAAASKSRITQSFSILSKTLQNNEAEILNTMKKSAQNINLIASMNLIENYQSVDNADNPIFEQEKQKMFTFLKSSISSQTDYIALYDTANILVTIIDNSKGTTSVKSITDELTLFAANFKHNTQSIYDNRDSILRFKSKTPILKIRANSQNEVVGYILTFKEYSPSYLSNMVLENMNISYAPKPTKTIKKSLKFSTSKYSMPQLFSEQDFTQLLIQKENNRFFSRVEFDINKATLLIRIEAK